ncbi:hypothetical protein [Humidesulfovibrio idahonensis]
MGKADWSLDLLERDLAEGFALLGRAERSGGLGLGESQALADGVLRCMNGALMKVSESLEAQAQLRRELDVVRTEMQQAQTAQAARIQSLETEVDALRKALRHARAQQEFSPRAERFAAARCPSDEHLSRPLVLRSQQGAFLGVTDRQGQALSLAGFLRLVEGGSPAPRRAGRVVATCWEPCSGGWCLTVSIMGPQPRGYVLETRSLRTPSENWVTLLAGMQVDGRDVPQDYVVQMFRQLREAFQE